MKHFKIKKCLRNVNVVHVLIKWGHFSKVSEQQILGVKTRVIA